MNTLALAEICDVVGGVREEGDGSRGIASVSTDTRHLPANSLFVALRGDRFDGHAFLADASAGGAVAALVDHRPKSAPANLALVIVPDTKAAMGKLASHVRKQFNGRVIAVAGSNGKTTTKHLIHAALRGDPNGRTVSSVPAASFRGTMSPKSFNNDIGVPLSIFPADPVDDYLILEIGTNHPGEILPLAMMSAPNLAVITNCSAEHLEGLGDEAGVRRENACVIQGLNPLGALIVNGDDPELLATVAEYSGRRVSFGFQPTNDLVATNIKCDADGAWFSVNQSARRFFVPILGFHTACNALAAIAVARLMGLGDDVIARNLATATGPEMRLQLQVYGGVRVLNDAYNANPASMKSALETLACLPNTGRRIAVLGEMRELGPASLSSHRQIGGLVAREIAPDLLVCVGSDARMIMEEAGIQGMPVERIAYFPTARSAEVIVDDLRDGDLVLLKASRAIGLEAVARAIADRATGARNPIATSIG